MIRYIDADKLRKDEIARCHCVPCVGSNDNNWKDLDEVLNDAPTADVEAVRHGRWLPIIERSSHLDPPYYDTGKCSSCGHIVDVSEMRYKYCPECGAKMDGERSEK